jgi:hypothetical protein
MINATTDRIPACRHCLGTGTINTIAADIAHGLLTLAEARTALAGAQRADFDIDCPSCDGTGDEA